MEHIDASHFLLILDYLCKGQCEIKCIDTLGSLLFLASKLEINDLEKQCIQHLLHRVDDENAFSVYVILFSIDSIERFTFTIKAIGNFYSQPTNLWNSNKLVIYDLFSPVFLESGHRCLKKVLHKFNQSSSVKYAFCIFMIRCMSASYDLLHHLKNSIELSEAEEIQILKLLLKFGMLFSDKEYVDQINQKLADKCK